jgi:hypothetical protein
VAGFCTKVEKCRFALEIIEGLATNKKMKYLQKSQCRFEGNTPFICCTKDNPLKRNTSNVIKTPSPNRASEQSKFVWKKTLQDRLPQYPSCGIQLSDRIFGGQVAHIDESPWSAILLYEYGNF